MNINEINTLKDLLFHDIEGRSLNQRKKVAKELYDSCWTWSRNLVQSFEEAVSRWEHEGVNAARDEINRIDGDFHAIDYWTLEDDSTTLQFLREDERFNNFALACANFYKSALSVKRIAYNEIEKKPNQFVRLEKDGVSNMVSAWRNEVETMLENVSREYEKVKFIKPI